MSVQEPVRDEVLDRPATKSNQPLVGDAQTGGGGKAASGRAAENAYPGRKPWLVEFYRSGVGKKATMAVTGIALLGFLFLHILGEAFMGVSQEAFDTIEDIYKNFFFRLMEVGLLFALVYHAVNGLRITLIDFFPSLCRRQSQLSIVQYLVTAALFFPPAVIMMAHYVNSRS